MSSPICLRPGIIMTYIMSEPQKRQNPNEHQHLAWKVLNPINTFYKAYLKKKKKVKLLVESCVPQFGHRPLHSKFSSDHQIQFLFLLSPWLR